MEPSQKYPKRQKERSSYGSYANSTERVRQFRAKQAQHTNSHLLNSISSSDFSVPYQGVSSNVEVVRSEFPHEFTENIDTMINSESSNQSFSLSSSDDVSFLRDELPDDECSNSSNSEPDLEQSDSEPNDDLLTKLQHWAIDNHCTRSTVNGMLKILRAEGYDNVPTDKRTLLGTIRDVGVSSTNIGDYINLGLKQCLEKVKNLASEVLLQFGIDGIPLFKNKYTLWPITVLINGIGPYVVSLWYIKGGKPKDVDFFLEDFLIELKLLISNGIDIKDKHHNIKLHSIICDAPARSSMKCIVTHTGYHSCERCTIYGSHKSYRVVFSEREETTKRTDVEFRSGNYANGVHPHQHDESPFCSLPSLDMIYLFPLDYMHLACLGVTRRLIHFFRGDYKGINEGKLSSSLLNTLNYGPSGLKNFSLPSEFNRMSRGIDELDHWKATELRTFMLYTGLVALKQVLTSSVYKHFLSFCIAMRILLESDNELRAGLLDDAESLLEYFVWNSKEHYGILFNVYNVHGLLHLVDDSRFYKCSLDSISAFPFENFLGHLKKLVRGKHSPLSQLAKRTDEWCRFKINGCLKKNVEKIDLNKNSWFLIDDGYVHLKTISGESAVVELYRHRVVENFFTYFVHSRDIGIVVIKKSLKPVVTRINFNLLIRKCVCLPYKDSWVLIKLLNDFRIDLH